MVKRNWSLCAFSAGLGFLLSTVSLACLISAFEVDCSVGALITWSLVGAIAWSICYTIPHSLIPLGIYALGVGYLWRSGVLYESIESLIFSVTTVYNRTYGWKIMGTQGSAEGMVCLFAVLITLFTARTICKKRSRLWPVLCCVLPLIPCFLSEDAVPELLWLGFWLFGVSLLLLTQPARRQQCSEKLTALLAVPLAAFTVLLLILLPQSAQEGPKAFAGDMVDMLQEMGIGTPDGKPMKVTSGAVELGKVGPRQESMKTVMTVVSDRGGTLYLRGCAYDTYFMNNWTNLTLIEDMYWPRNFSLEEAGTVSVKTEEIIDLRYFPYYATGGELLDVSRGINNFSKKTEYSYELGVLVDQKDTYTYAPNHGYTQMPTITQRWAKPVVEQLVTPDMTDREKIIIISGYVKGLAKYSLHAEKMPEDEKDFVVWFAERADKGYCIHFASAGIMLLRAAGIPTRYVTGYMVQTKPGVETKVYGKNAHAWAECFLDGLGWVPVELTPSAEPEEEERPTNVSVHKNTVQQDDSDAYTIIMVAVPVVVLLTVLIRWPVRVLLRRRKRRKGDNRSRLLATYRQLSELMARDKKQPGEDLQQLAERAAFSNHPVEQADCEKLEKALVNAIKRLKKHSVFKRLYYRLVRNLY